MNTKDLKDNPYNKYINDRSRELIMKLANSLNNHHGSFVRSIADLCYSVSVDEAEIMENQAVLNDPSPYKDGSRDKLLKMFGKTFINGVLSNRNQTYKDFDKGYMNIKDGDNE